MFLVLRAIFILSFSFRYFYTKIYGMKKRQGKKWHEKREFSFCVRTQKRLSFFEKVVSYLIANYLISSQLYPKPYIQHIYLETTEQLIL